MLCTHDEDASGSPYSRLSKRMTIDRLNLQWPELKKLGRDAYRLQAIMQIRNSVKPDLTVIDDESKRIELVIRYWCRENAQFRDLFAEAIYADPDFFRKLNLSSPDTILRDNRELEKAGYFQKPEDLPRIAQIE